MTKIHLNRNREALGQFTPDAIAEGLQSGRFKSTDLAWQEGMDAWKPISEWTDLPVVTVQEFLSSNDPLVPVPAVMLESAIEPQRGVMPAWESEGDQAFLQRVIGTVKESLGSPGVTFSHLSKAKAILRPFLYFLMLGTAGNIIALGYQLAFSIANPEHLTKQAPTFPVEWIVPIYLVAMFLMPVIVSVIAFLTAGLYHLGLMITGSAKEGFATTFRVACYVHGSTSIFQCIPFCGQYVQIVWNLVGVVIGLHKAHKIAIAPAIVAVIVPMVLLCGFMIAVLTLVFGAAVAGGAGAVGP